MTETQRRIRAYKKALPALRERVIAVALLLVMSTSMLSTASFAWLTLSRNPEVTAVATNIAANGNLEIALATSDTPPGASQVGDSSATPGKTDAVVTSNLTWGNLVNLSDDSYGLEKMVMRPAKLNTDSLLSSPLWGAAYGTDGRIIELDSKFGYTIYEFDEYAEGGGKFINVPEGEYGIRAISSMKMDSSSAEAKLYDAIENVKRANGSAADAYTDLGNDTAKISSLATMMGLFMTARMAEDGDTERENPEVKIGDLTNLHGLYLGFLEAMELEAEAMAAQINLVLAQNVTDGSYTPVTKEDILTNQDLAATLSNRGIVVTKLGQVTDDVSADDKTPAGTFRGDYNIIATDVLALEELKNTGENQKWQDCGLERIVSRLVNVDQCVVDNQEGSRLRVNQIGVTAAMEYLDKDCLAEITNGILYRFEERTGARLRISNMSITVSVKRSIIQQTRSINATIYTTAYTDLEKNYPNIRDWPHGRYLFGRDMKTNLEDLHVNAVMTAQDTYGLAIDLWVRTNAAGSYLTLEGNAITESHEERATGKDGEGIVRELWTLTRGSGEEEHSIDLYLKETSENGETWFNADTHEIVPLATDENGNVTEEPKPKMDTIITVIGYEGENRVWSSDTSYSNMLSTDATTQGSGSCYVYYADTPEDQARSLKLLESFKVAFVDDAGELMASAYMDTKRAYEATGRVTVPLVLDPVDSDNLGADDYGNVTYGITPLEEDVPKRITALVYLDGTDLYNEDVLSAADIQGQLNIQFGSSSIIEPIKNDDLMMEEIHLNAKVDVTSIRWEDDNKTVNVTLNVEGVNPNKVTGFFMRQINSMQGSREKEMTFNKVSDNGADDSYQSTWEGRYTFTAPGDYILRMVRLDGVDYDIGEEIPMFDESGNPVLDENGNQKNEVKYPQTSVSGFAVTKVTQSTANTINKHIDVFSTDRYTPVNVSLGFGTSNASLMPKTVQVRYVREEDQTIVSGDLVYKGGDSWSGTVNFNRSGKYTLKFVLLDGKYTELPEDLWRTLDLTLGVYVEVQTSSPTSFVYIPEEAETEDNKMTEDERLLKMYVSIKDDTNEPLEYQKNVNLYYTAGGNSNMEALNMTWNGDRYEGEFPVTGPGSYKFSRVEIGESILRVARTAPVFTIMSMDPPDYEPAGLTPAYQYAPNGDAYMVVRLTNAAAASVRATIVNEDNGATFRTNEAVEVGRDVLDDGTPYTDWKLQYRDPNTKALAWPQGNWKLSKLELGNVYIEDENGEGHMYIGTDPATGAEDYYEMPVTDEVRTKVVTSVTVRFDTDKSKAFGVDADGKITDGFLEKTYDITDLSVRIEDFEHKPLDNVKNVRMEITYVFKSSASEGKYGIYGGYTTEQLDNTTPGVSTTVTLAADKDENGNLTGTYSQSSTNNTIKFAGSYTTVLKYDIGPTGSEVTVSHSSNDKNKLANIPVFEVYTKAPVVTVTGVGTSNETIESKITTNYRIYSVKNPVSRNQLIGGDAGMAFSSFTPYTAVTYIQVPPMTGNRDQEAAEACAPTVTLGLTGVPDGTTGTMTFTTKNADSENSVFTFANGTATAKVGKAVNGERQNDIALGLGADPVVDYPECYPAGTMTQNLLSVTCGGITYQVTLSNAITLDQPLSPTAMIFAGIPESYTGTRPAQVIGQGTTVTTTLPEAMYWEATIEEPQGGTWTPYKCVGHVDQLEDGTTDTRVLWYTTWTKSSGCSNTTYYKQYIYHWAKFESEITAETDIYTQAYKITKWKINDKVYNAGETVSVSGDGIITATAQYEYDGPKTFVETKEATTYKHLYGYCEDVEVKESEDEPNYGLHQREGANPGTKENDVPPASAKPNFAVPSTADAATDTVGTNMSTDVAAYTKYW